MSSLTTSKIPIIHFPPNPARTFSQHACSATCLDELIIDSPASDFALLSLGCEEKGNAQGLLKTRTFRNEYVADVVPLACSQYYDRLLLYFKTSLHAKPFKWKWVLKIFIMLAWKWTCRRNTFLSEWFRRKSRFDKDKRQLAWTTGECSRLIIYTRAG